MTTELSSAALSTLLDIVRAERGDYQPNLLAGSYDTALDELFAKGLLGPSRRGVATTPLFDELFVVFDPEFGIGGEREPRNAGRFEITRA